MSRGGSRACVGRLQTGLSAKLSARTPTGFPAATRDACCAMPPLGHDSRPQVPRPGNAIMLHCIAARSSSSHPSEGFHPTHCRSLLLRMELSASQVAVCGTPALHCAAFRLGMQTFDTTSLVKVGCTVHQLCFFSSFVSCGNFIFVSVVHLQNPGHQLHLL